MSEAAVSAPDQKLMEYPRWLYSKDHGSVVVDSQADAAALPNSDWYATPNFLGEPLHKAFDINDTTSFDGPKDAQISPLIARLDAEIEKIDKRTKAYKESQK